MLDLSEVGKRKDSTEGNFWILGSEQVSKCLLSFIELWGKSTKHLLEQN